MKIGKQVRRELIDGFENTINQIERFDDAGFSLKRAAAEAAADAAIIYIEFCTSRKPVS